MSYSSMYLEYTDISRKVVGKSASDNPERYCVFSHDVMAAIFVSQNNETAAMFVCSKTADTIQLYVFKLLHSLKGKTCQQDEKTCTNYN